MTDARKPIGWVRNDREVTWWGADYPVHWEPGEGFAVYGEPPAGDRQGGHAVNAAEALRAYCLRQAESNADEAVRYDEDAAEWAANPDPDKAKRASHSHAAAADCRRQVQQFSAWGALLTPSVTQGLRVALGECQDKLWIARCDSGDEKFRAAAERACGMATEALKVPEPTPVCGTCNDHGMIGGPVGQTAESLDFITEVCPDCTARYAAFRAGWRTNAALPADDPEYFERCTETDWQVYLKRGASGYDVHLDESAQELETEAALALSEDVPAVEAAAEALHQIGRRYGWWTSMGLMDREGYRTPGDPIAQREFEGLVEEILAAGRVVHTDAYKAATEALEKCWGALNFILAFYEPGQRHLDTNAWKQAEASGRRAHARARVVLDALKIEPEDEENPWRTQSEWSDLLRLRDDFIVNEGLWSSFTDHLEKVEQLARKS